MSIVKAWDKTKNYGLLFVENKKNVINHLGEDGERFWSHVSEL